MDPQMCEWDCPDDGRDTPATQEMHDNLEETWVPVCDDCAALVDESVSERRPL